MAEPDGVPVGAASLSVVQVGPDQWQVYRDVRIASLVDSPRAFWATYAEASGRTQEQWRGRLGRDVPTWVALEGGRPVGTVALWHAPDQPAGEGLLIGMWVASAARGAGVADALVRVALEHARELGWRRVLLDVAHENRRAGAFYRRLGFAPTGAVGEMPWDPSVTEETLALDLAI
ncbi:MAG: GNAT family N-acetyltransferase [Ornithinibacter sp.]